MSDTAYGKRRFALAVLCAVQLMVFLDASAINVALAAIQRSLRLDATGLAWVVDAYLIAFGGLLLLAGRMGDLFGRRRALIAGVVAFTVASAGCALAPSAAALIAWRAAQGLSAAVVSPLVLAQVVTLHPAPERRTRALGVLSFVSAGGGSLGVLAGGALTAAAGWRAIFLINVPIGVAAVALLPRMLPADAPPGNRPRLDLLGALLITSAAGLLSWALTHVAAAARVDAEALAGLAVAVVGATGAVWRQRRASEPLVPPALLRSHGVPVANVLAALVRAALFGWFFFAALFLQRVLGYSALETGLAFLPTTVLTAVGSIVLAPRALARYGARAVFGAGAALVALGLAWFAWIPSDASFGSDLLPGLVLLGGGGGLLFLPLTTAATSSVPPEHVGAAAGLLSTAQQLGGAVGLAVLTSAAAARTPAPAAGAISGYRVAFWLSAALALLAALLGWLRLTARERVTPATPAAAEAAAGRADAADVPGAPPEHAGATAAPAPAWAETDPR